jgi:uncharacterized protein YbaR (Trm112 family)
MTTAPPINPQLLSLVRCPITQAKLNIAAASMIDRLNQAIMQRTLVNRVGQTVEEPLQTALVNEHEDWLFPIRDGILVLIADQAIEPNQLG